MQDLVASGKPFICGIYLGGDPATISMRDKTDRKKREDRVVIKHLVKNRNGIHVHTEWLDGGHTEEHAAKLVTIKTGTPVLVVLSEYARDGVGIAFRGEITVDLNK